MEGEPRDKTALRPYDASLVSFGVLNPNLSLTDAILHAVIFTVPFFFLVLVKVWRDLQVCWRQRRAPKPVDIRASAEYATVAAGMAFFFSYMIDNALQIVFGLSEYAILRADPITSECLIERPTRRVIIGTVGLAVIPLFALWEFVLAVINAASSVIRHRSLRYASGLLSSGKTIGECLVR